MLDQLDSMASTSGQLQSEKVLGQRNETDVKVTLRLKDKLREMTYPEAFVFAHQLAKRRKFKPAATVFEQLSRVPDHGTRAHLMLAICNAGLSQYSKVLGVLKQVFSETLTAAIYEVIIQSRMGFKEDALHDLADLVNEHKQSPTLCLWLGDMLEANHRIDKAILCWNLAQTRDRPGGAVALAAGRQLRRLKGPDVRPLPPPASGSA